MARPIQPTPTLRGEDAERLRRDLAAVECSPEEHSRRAELARRRLREMMRPKKDYLITVEEQEQAKKEALEYEF